MDHQEDPKQLLWEFVYDLLPERDAAELRKLITSDPDLAREYVRVKQRSELVADAAQIEMPQIKLRKPSQRSVVLSRTLRSLTTPRVRSFAVKTGNALIAAAATVLLCMIGYGYLQPRTRSIVQPVAVDLVRAEVCVPQKINPETANFISVQTNSAIGEPLSTRVQYGFFDARGDAQLQQELVTDPQGWGQIELPRSIARSAVELKVRTGGSEKYAVAANLSQTEPRQMTYVALDKREYRPGETIQYRSVTLSQLGLVSDHESTVEVRVEAAGQNTSLAGPQQVQTRRGVGMGSLPLPAKTASGKYRLVARSPSAEFDDVIGNFVVREPRDLNVTLQLARNRQTAGDEVVGQIQVFRASGEPAVGAKLKADATVNDRDVIAESELASADDKGTGEVRLQLPPEHANKPSVLNVKVTDRDREAKLAQQIPSDDSEFDTVFYPEGGELAAGFMSRVYFTCRARGGQPVQLSGRVVDSGGNEVATAETTSDGRGVFTFTPKLEETYRLDLPSSAQIAVDPILLPFPARTIANLAVEQSVLPADSPVMAELRVSKPESRLLVAAYCRGVLVGQQWIGESRFAPVGGGHICLLQLPLSGEANGAIRLVVFDYQGQSPTALSERLVFRRPTHPLKLKVAQVAAADQHRLRFDVIDEQSRPLGAVLGIQVTRIASGRVGSDDLSMAAYYYLATELDRPQEIGDGLRYLDDTPESTAELDLLLGTQSARRFRQSRATMFARTSPIRTAPLAKQEVSKGRAPESRADRQRFARAADELLASVAVSPPELASPVLFSNAAEFERAAAVARRPVWELDVAFLGKFLVWGGAALAAAAVLCAVLRYPRRSLYLTPIYATSLGALIVGAMWMSGRPMGERQIALAPQSLEFKKALATDKGESVSSGTKSLAADRAIEQRATEKESKDVAENFAPAAPSASTAPLEEVAEHAKLDASVAKELAVRESPRSSAMSDALGAPSGMPGMAPGMAGGAMGGGAGGYGGAPGAFGGGVAMKAAAPTPSAPPAPSAPGGTSDRYAAEPAGKAQLFVESPAPSPVPAPAQAPAQAPGPAPAAAPALAAQMPMLEKAGPSAARRDPTLLGKMNRAAGSEQNRDNKLFEQLQRRFMFAPEVTLSWLPRVELSETGTTTVDLPKAGASRVRVRADAHAGGNLGSIDVTLDVPDAASR